ncbi:MAG: lytic transglycosylase domain-containing protein [Sphingobium sp.]
MASIRGMIAAVALLSATPAQADEVARWRPFIEEASTRFGIPTRWIEQVMRAESGGRTQLNGRPIRSRKGAMGLMQLMPGTWAEMRSRLGLGNDPDNPRDNILAGTFYLRLMYDRFGYPGLFAAYNAGPGRYAEHLAGRPLPAETIAYLAGIGEKVASPAPHKPPSLFVVQRVSGETVDAEAKPNRIDPLFAIRSDGR